MMKTKYLCDACNEVITSPPLDVSVYYGADNIGIFHFCSGRCIDAVMNKAAKALKKKLDV